MKAEKIQLFIKLKGNLSRLPSRDMSRISLQPWVITISHDLLNPTLKNQHLQYFSFQPSGFNAATPRFYYPTSLWASLVFIFSVTTPQKPYHLITFPQTHPRRMFSNIFSAKMYFAPDLFFIPRKISWRSILVRCSLTTIIRASLLGSRYQAPGKHRLGSIFSLPVQGDFHHFSLLCHLQLTIAMHQSPSFSSRGITEPSNENFHLQCPQSDNFYLWLGK